MVWNQIKTGILLTTLTVILLEMYRAKPAHKSTNPELYEIVEDLAKEAKLPIPKIYIIPIDQPNAFATGRNPKHSAVAVTEGIIHLLSKEELKGVLAHEMAHIKNRDILISTVSAVIAGTIAYIAMMARWAAIFGGFGGRDNDVNIFEILALAIVAPLVATIVRLAISRSREYLADSTGAKFIHDGVPLANALNKMENYVKNKPLKKGNNATAHMFIVNPFRGNAILELFSTHPSTRNRISKLRNMAF